jgi:surfeit locus 1 family protein
MLTLGGAAALIALGFWQLDRMGQKRAQIDAIEAVIHGAPGPVPSAPDPMADEFKPVEVAGALAGEEAHVLTTRDGRPGFRVVAALTAGDRRLLVDLGFVPEAGKGAPRLAERVAVTGNLHWPDDADAWTPAPDAARNIWFSREVGPLAAALGTEPVMVVARQIGGADLGVAPWPIDTAAIPDDHLEYAITWFLLAAVWTGLGALLIRRAGRGRA